MMPSLPRAWFGRSCPVSPSFCQVALNLALRTNKHRLRAAIVKARSGHEVTRVTKYSKWGGKSFVPQLRKATLSLLRSMV